jgi:thioredoxin-related protein
MERLLLAAVLVAVAVVVAFLVDRRRPQAPTQPREWPVPAQLDRSDFVDPDKPWLVVVFSSSTCESCAKATSDARLLASPQLAVEEVEAAARRDLHARYGIEAVPTIVLADDEGVVRASFVGPPSATDLWSAVAEARGD